MPAQVIFLSDMVLGYLAAALFVGAYAWPRLRAMDPKQAQRAIATLHSFRFFGLVFLLPGFVGAGLPQGFAESAAYGDFAAGVLALLALLTVRLRPAFWVLVWAFNLVGLADLVNDTVAGVRMNLPAAAGQLGAAYAILMLYVPTLFWTHLAAFWLLLRSRSGRTASAQAPLAAAR
jgi:hypothetical protein